MAHRRPLRKGRFTGFTFFRQGLPRALAGFLPRLDADANRLYPECGAIGRRTVEATPVDLYLSLRAGGHHHYCDGLFLQPQREDVRAGVEG